jgi:hypothetical protein
MKRTILVIILILVVVAVIVGIKLYREQTPDVVNKKPDLVTDAATLLAAFDRDTASASKQYLDKIIEVTGNVKTIDTSGSVVLGEEGSASEVTFGIDRRHMKDFEKLKAGTKAVLQGVCSGYSKGSGGDDLLANLGTTVEFRSAGVKEKQ